MPIITPTETSVQQELIQKVCQLYQQIWCGIDCNNKYLENKIYRLYDYLWLLRNDECDTNREIICIIKNNA